MEQTTEKPVFLADDNGAKAKALWEMTQTEGWGFMRGMFLVPDEESKNARWKADKEVRRPEPNYGSRDYWAGKLDTCAHIEAWIRTSIRDGVKREQE